MFRKYLFTLILFLQACNNPMNAEIGHDKSIEVIIQEYLLLELSMGIHHQDHVDAYFGPEDIKTLAVQKNLAVSQIHKRAEILSKQIEVLTNNPMMPIQRSRNLQARLLALTTRIKIFTGELIPFDQETQALFSVVAPYNEVEYFNTILTKIDRLIPGDEELSIRVNTFKQQFIIQPQYLETVFNAAIEECRRRTLRYIELPSNEKFTLEYVQNKPWSGYNWYQGGSHSIIQINTDLPIMINRAVDLGCHEGYPGHHTYNSLIETNLVQQKNWLEYTLYPLYGPQSLIAEGSANYGIQLAFLDQERMEFEKNILFKLAKLDTKDVDRYYQLLALQGKLNYAGNEAARRYLNKEITRDQAIEWLIKYTLTSKESAEKSTKFYDTYRSYVINYNLGKDIVKQYIETTTDSHDVRWEKFEQLLSEPMLPIDLKNLEQ